MQTLLFVTGLGLFLLGLLTGFAVPGMKNPRMGLTSHLEAHLNGMFLVVLGLLWPFVQLDAVWERVAVGLLIYGAFANWFSTLLAGIWGAGGKMMKIAAANHVGSPARERFIMFLLVTLSIADVLGVGIVLFGIVRP